MTPPTRLLLVLLCMLDAFYSTLGGKPTVALNTAVHANAVRCWLRDGGVTTDTERLPSSAIPMIHPYPLLPIPRP